MPVPGGSTQSVSFKTYPAASPFGRFVTFETGTATLELGVDASLEALLQGRPGVYALTFDVTGDQLTNFAVEPTEGPFSLDLIADVGTFTSLAFAHQTSTFVFSNGYKVEQHGLELRPIPPGSYRNQLRPNVGFFYLPQSDWDAITRVNGDIPIRIDGVMVNGEPTQLRATLR